MGYRRPRRAAGQTLIAHRAGTAPERNASRRKDGATRLLGTLAKRHERPKTVKKEMPTETQRQKTENMAGSILAVGYGRARICLAIAETEAQHPPPPPNLDGLNSHEDKHRLHELS